MAISHGGVTIEWLGYATIRITTDEITIYLDPGRYGVLTGEWTADSEDAANQHPPARDVRPKDGDLVCISHRHHYDPDGIQRVTKEDGTVVAFEGIDPRNSSRDLPRFVDLPYDVVRVGDQSDRLVADVPLWTVPAYNEPDGPHTRSDGTPYHPKGRGCGFLLAIGDRRVFWPGDTDVLDGHAALDVDVFLPPIGGTFTMDRQAAASLSGAMEPELVVPVHYNTFEAIETDVTAFETELRNREIAVERDEN